MSRSTQQVCSSAAAVGPELVQRLPVAALDPLQRLTDDGAVRLALQLQLAAAAEGLVGVVALVLHQPGQAEDEVVAGVLRVVADRLGTLALGGGVLAVPEQPQ